MRILNFLPNQVESNDWNWNSFFFNLHKRGCAGWMHIGSLEEWDWTFLSDYGREETHSMGYRVVDPIWACDSLLWF